MTESGPRASTSGDDPGRVLKGFLGILTGSTLAQLLAFAALPVLSRLYTPAETAHYALLLGIGVVIASFASLRLDLAVPIPKDIDESRRLFWLSALAPLIVLPFTGLLVGLLHVAGVGSAETLDWVDYTAIAVFVLVVGLFSTASQLAIRLQSYGVLGRIPLIQMMGTLVAQVALGAVGFSRGLFVGGLVGRSLGIVGLIRSCNVRMADLPEREQALALLKRYWRFPVIFAPASLVNVLGSNLAALLLPTLFGFGPAGLYAMAARVSGVPGEILSQSAGQVFLGEFARASTRTASLRVFFRWSAALLFIGSVVSATIWVLAPIVLPPLLGSEWEGTAQLAQYSGIMAGAAIFGSPVQHVWTVRQRGLMQFSWNIIRLGVTAAVILTGAQGNDSLDRVIAELALATVLVYVLAWLGCLWAASRPAAGHRGDASLEPPFASGGMSL